MQTEMEYVYTVYKEKSFSKAAKKLFVSQSAISSMVKKAEDKLGCALFDRSSIPLDVTKEGEYYIHCIERIMDIEHEIESFFKDARDLKTGDITIGTSSYYCVNYIAEMVKAFRTKYPGIKCEIYDGNTRELDQWLSDNRMDLIFGAISEKPAVNETFFFEKEHLVLGVPKNYPINEILKDYRIPVEKLRNDSYLKENIPPVPLIAFKDYPFVSLRQGNDMYSRCIQICKNAGFTPKQSFLLDQFITAFYTACAGAGVIMVRSTLTETLTNWGNLIYYYISDPLTERPINFSIKKRPYIKHSVRAFLTLAYSMYHKPLPIMGVERPIIP